MAIEFTTPSSNDPLHLADAIVVRDGHVLLASVWNLLGNHIVDAPERIDSAIEAAILESFELAESF